MPFVNSSAISSVKYDPASRQMQVWFVKSGGPYTYFGVPEAVYLAFMATPSKGTFFTERIRDVYNR